MVRSCLIHLVTFCGWFVYSDTYAVNSVSCFFPVFISGMMVGGWSTSCNFRHSLLLLLSHSGPSHHRGDSASLTGPVPLEPRSAIFCSVGTCCHWAGRVYICISQIQQRGQNLSLVHGSTINRPCCQSRRLRPSTVLLLLLKRTGLTSTQQWHSWIPFSSPSTLSS